jgi:formamidopyrimidine-DNA glycosylase
MPELPEVETIVRQLDRVLPGKVIEAVEVLREKSFGFAQDKSLPGESWKLIGKKIEKVERRQKIIVISLSEDLVLLVHLKMTGQLIYVPKSNSLGFQPVSLKKGDSLESRIVGGHPTADWIGELPSKHTRVVIKFADKSILYFNDQRVFGWIKVVPSEQWLVLSEKMPPDVVDEGFTLDYFTRVLKKSTRAIKLVILDQSKMGGMGNIYACDALFLAEIHPLRKSNELTVREIKLLHESMIAALHKGIETGGASLSHFVDTQGLGGHYQDHFMVYGRAMSPCHKCHNLIEKIVVGGRGTYFCPKCQR